jgi:hypothetical protein
MLQPSADQAEFDTIYITSSEICSTLNVKRSTLVMAKHRGQLPEPIVVNGCNMHIWKRADVMPYIKAWDLQLRTRRGENIL